MRLPLLCLLVIVALLGSARAAEPFFKKNDVIALVGGEDMVVASEYGYLETLLTRALPDYHLRFRNLAWEGDTVYEQRRDLNFPTWEEQLDKIGATVVICQFGQMESLDGKEKLTEFVDSYQKLLDRLMGTAKRRIIIVTPTPFGINGPGPQFASQHNPTLDSYVDSIRAMAAMHGIRCVDDCRSRTDPLERQTRDGAHLSAVGQMSGAEVMGQQLDAPLRMAGVAWSTTNGGTLRQSADGRIEDLRQLIVAKNRLWFNYWRVQNWAFLFGDRTNQPSSRDWRDPSKRWFPAEREEFIPLIEAKEKEIDALAAKLNQK